MISCLKSGPWAAMLCLILLTVPTAAGTGLAPLQAGFGSRSAILGGPNPADGDAESLYWNPAGLALPGATRLMASHFFWLDGISFEQFGLVFPAPWTGMWGLGSALMVVPAFNSTGNLQSESAHGLEGSAWLSAGIQILPDLDLGLSAKTIFRKWMDEPDWGAAVDAGLVYRPPVAGLQVQASVLNAGGLRGSNMDPLPLQTLAGATYQFPIWLETDLRVNAGGLWTKNDGLGAYTGAEVILFDHLTLRSGLEIQSNRLCPGMGGSLSWDPLRLDYGTKNLPELGWIHQLSLQASWPSACGSIQADFSAYGEKLPNGRFQQTMRLQADSAVGLARWHLILQTASGLPCQEWSGLGQPPEEIVWDWKDRAGRLLPEDLDLHYRFRVEDRAFRSRSLHGQLLSRAAVLAPKLRILQTGNSEAHQAQLRFSIRSAGRVYEPKEWTLAFKSAEGKILKQFTRAVREPKSLPQGGFQNAVLPEGAVSCTLTFLDANRQTQTVSAPVLTISAGPLVLVEGMPGLIPMPLSIHGKPVPVTAWKFELFPSKTADGRVALSGKGMPAQALSWQPDEFPDTPEDLQTIRGQLQIQDPQGITWTYETPVPLIRAKGRITPTGGRVIVIGQILFGFNEATLQASAAARLDAVAALLIAFPQSRAEIQGHTDEVGSQRYNQDLSRRRAFAVKRYLVETGGWDGSRFSCQGLGSRHPFRKAATEAERRWNRRVEIVITLPAPNR